MACLNVTIYENTSPWCWFTRSIPFSTPCDNMLALLTLWHPVWLSLFLYIFSHLPVCSCMYCCVCFVCVIKPGFYNLVWVHTLPWYTRLRVPFRSFAWWYLCHPYSNPVELWTLDPDLHFVLQWHPFCLIICLFAPVWLSLLVCPFTCFLSSCFVACLLVLCLLSLHVHTWSKDVTP